MLITLAVLAALDAAPTPTVELTLTGTAASAPVSAAPRSLSDVARERREGRKAVGGFSAVETTVPSGLQVPLPEFEWVEEPAASRPEVPPPPPPEYVTTYFPGAYGGGTWHGAHHRHPAFRGTAPGAGPRVPAVRPSARAPRPMGTGGFRLRRG